MINYIPGWQETLLWVVILAYIFAFVVAFGLGANDCANSYGTSVGSKVLTLIQAYILATIFENLGAALLGIQVINKIREGIVNVTVYDVYVERYNGNYSLANSCAITTHDFGPLNDSTVSDCIRYTSAEYYVGMVAVLAGVAIWLITATFLKLPVSTTHSVVGATVGFSLVFRGSGGIDWASIAKIVVSWITSPIIAGLLSILFYMVIQFTALTQDNQAEASLRMLPLFLWFTISTGFLSILLDGSKQLGFDKLPWWGGLLISVGIGAIAAISMHFAGSPYIRRKLSEIKETFTRDKIQAISTQISKDLLLIPLDRQPPKMFGSAESSETVGETQKLL